VKASFLRPGWRGPSRSRYGLWKPTGECPLSDGVADGEWQDTTFGDELWGRFPAVAADVRATIALRSAADHALAAAGCLTTRPFASLTLARAVIEASAVSAFLSDPGD
jgi:hypothetical protein